MKKIYTMEPLPWIERKFVHGLNPRLMPYVIERLLGAPVRLRKLVDGVKDSIASVRHHGKWSIKEHVGHLSDLEALHDGRIDDFNARTPTLRAADMSNTATEEANHNSKNLSDLLDRFDRVRAEFIGRLSSLNDATQQFEAMHPRLKIPMRPVDMAYFVAEHDDHHLTLIRALLRKK
jgi:uncharacterized damage-inducible protein DinB